MNVRHLEFIGPSGVGKTTLAAQVARDLPSSWITKSHARSLMEEQNEGTAQTTYGASLIAFLLDAKRGSSMRSFPTNIEKQEQLLNFFRSELLLDHAIFSRVRNHRVFSDDGISHNFGPELLTCFDDTALRLFFARRDIVHLTASLSTIKDHLKKRSEQTPNALNDWYGHYHGNTEALANSILTSIRRSAETSTLAARLGCRVLHLNAEEGIDVNKWKVLEFIT